MKLRNKLIPLMSTAAIAATVAPITLTSCSGGMVNLLNGNGYVPSIERAKWNEYTSNKTDMLHFYAAAINENPEIFAQDMYWSDSHNMYAKLDAYNYMLSEEGAIFTPNYAQSKVSNIKISTLECKEYWDEDDTSTEYNPNPTTTVKHYALSFDYVIRYGVTIDTLGLIQQQSIDYTITVKNFPVTINRADFVLDYDTDEVMSNIAFVLGLLPTDWVIETEVKCDHAGEGVKGPSERILRNLEANGYEWLLKARAHQEETTTFLRQPKKPTQEKYEKNYFVNKADTLFDLNLPEYSDEKYGLISYVSTWYLPTYYLSDIVDENHQIWG